jgi:hypothetical protein
MEAMPQEWTEGRLDDLSSKVDQGFEKADADARVSRIEMRTEFAAMRSEMKGMRVELRDEIKGLRGEMGRIDERIDSVQRAIAFGAVALTGAILAGFAAMCTLLAAAL